MSIKEAINDLTIELMYDKNIVSLGIGDNKIYIYTKYKTQYLKLLYPKGFKGFPIVVKRTSHIRPL